MAFKLPGLRLDEWKTLDPKEPWTWPGIPKALFFSALAAGVLVAGYFGVISGKQDDLATAQAKQETLMAEYKTKYAQGVNLDAYKKQRLVVEKTFGELLRQLPSKAEMEALLTDVNQAGTGRGLVFDLFKPAEKEVLSDFYAEQPISIKLSGLYHDFGSFSSAVAHLDRIVTLNDLVVTGSANGKLTMEATAKTFRYLDEKEMLEQKKLAKSKPAAKENN